MISFLAQQQIDNVPAEFLKSFTIMGLVIVGTVAATVVILGYFRKPEATRLRDEPPIKIEKTAKRFNHDLAESRFAEHNRRLEAHDAEIEQLWMTMRREDAEMKADSNEKFLQIMEALGEIKGRLNK